VILEELPKGTPYRHVRARAQVLLYAANENVRYGALVRLLARYPTQTLQALADATEAEEE